MRKMYVVCLLLLTYWTVVGQQKLGNHPRERYVEVPRELVLLAVAFQPNCPLQIEDTSFLFDTRNPKTVVRYRVRNVSSKPIVSFTVVSWSTRGGEGTLPVLLAGSSRPLYPGHVLDSLEGAAEIAPLTEEFRKKLKREQTRLFEGKMVETKILLIDQVLFADGSSYRDQKVSEALSEHLAEVVRDSQP